MLLPLQIQSARIVMEVNWPHAGVWGCEAWHCAVADLAETTNWGSFSVGVLITRALIVANSHLDTREEVALHSVLPKCSWQHFHCSAGLVEVLQSFETKCAKAAPLQVRPYRCFSPSMTTSAGNCSQILPCRVYSASCCRPKQMTTSKLCNATFQIRVFVSAKFLGGCNSAVT